MKKLVLGTLLFLMSCGGKIGLKDDPNRHKVLVNYATTVGQGMVDLCPNSRFAVSPFPITKAFSYTDEKVEKLVISFDGTTNHLLDVSSKENFFLNNTFSGRLLSFVNLVDKKEVTLNFSLMFSDASTFSFTLFSQRSETPIQIGAETLILKEACSQIPVFFKVETRYEDGK